MPAQRIDFPGSQGARLAARLELPEPPKHAEHAEHEPRAFALFAHCFTCGKDVAAATRIASGLTGAGFGVLRFDFTGLGHSEGDFASTNFSSNVGDLVAASDWLAEHHAAPGLLVGHSLGGAAVLAAAPKIDACRAVATIGAPADPAHIEHLLSGSTERIEREGEVELSLAGRPFTIRRQFLDDIRTASLIDALPNLGRALLIMHSPTDAVVGVENAERIYTAARHPKSFVSLDGADHMLTKRDDAAFVAAVLGAWAQRYVESA